MGSFQFSHVQISSKTLNACEILLFMQYFDTVLELRKAYDVVLPYPRPLWTYFCVFYCENKCNCPIENEAHNAVDISRLIFVCNKEAVGNFSHELDFFIIIFLEFSLGFLRHYRFKDTFRILFCQANMLTLFNYCNISKNQLR